MPDSATAETLLAGLITSQVTPTAIELLAGPVWESEPTLGDLPRSGPAHLFLVVGLEGSAAEVEAMTRRLASEWDELGIGEPLIVGQSADLWRRLIAFPAAGESPLVLKASVVPSGTTAVVAAARKLDPQCSIQAHAGNGSVIIRFAKFPGQGLSRALVGDLLPIATTHRGNVVVLSNPSGAEMTHQSVWGAIDAPLDLMSEVKRRFDPRDILNRGRFVYTS